MNKILIIGLFLLVPFVSFAQWDDCPHGKTNDSCEYPGECGRYTDTNKDGICDHSQEAPVVASATEQSSQIDTANTTDTSEAKSKNYPLFAIAAFVTISYGITHILSQNKAITVLTHRKIWNGVMTIVFFVTSLLGILLILQLNSGKSFRLPFDLLYWHVVTGIVMMVVALFHIGWHWRYYKNFFKK